MHLHIQQQSRTDITWCFKRNKNSELNLVEQNKSVVTNLDDAFRILAYKVENLNIELPLLLNPFHWTDLYSKELFAYFEAEVLYVPTNLFFCSIHAL